MSFPRAKAERRSVDTTDLWEERGGASWGSLVLTALRARELYVVRRPPPLPGPPQPGTWAAQHTLWRVVPTCRRCTRESAARGHGASARRALTGRLCTQRDVHYLVRDGEVKIIDRATGRVQPISRWNDGIHSARLPPPACLQELPACLLWQGRVGTGSWVELSLRGVLARM